VSYLPIGVDARSIRDFRSGGIMGFADRSFNWIDKQGGKWWISEVPGRSVAIEWLVGRINTVLEKSGNSLCLFENGYASASDPVVRKHYSKIVTCGEDVYHVLSSNAISEKQCKKAIVEAQTSLELVGACSLLGPDFDAIQDRLSLEQIGYIAAKAEMIICGAFDGEGFIVWQRDVTVHAPG
jgi:hypothetical protein